MTIARGMTLLEVMVALAIFALAALSLVRTTGQQMVAISAMEEKTFATWVADNKQAELRLSNTWPNLSWAEGTEEMANQKWYWRWKGVETEDEKFRALDVEVRLDPKSENPRATLRTYVNR